MGGIPILDKEQYSKPSWQYSPICWPSPQKNSNSVFIQMSRPHSKPNRCQVHGNTTISRPYLLVRLMIYFLLWLIDFRLDRLELENFKQRSRLERDWGRKEQTDKGHNYRKIYFSVLYPCSSPFPQLYQIFVYPLLAVMQQRCVVDSQLTRKIISLIH